MIEEISLTLRKQTPSVKGNWLWKDQEFDYFPRMFRPYVYLGKKEKPWNECTDQERIDYEEEWKRTHPEPETELIANEGCWIVESAKFNDKEYREKSGNWHRLKVNNPADYEEVTDAAWQSYCEEYDHRHPQPTEVESLDTQEEPEQEQHDPLDVHWENPEEQEAQV